MSIYSHSDKKRRLSYSILLYLQDRFMFFIEKDKNKIVLHSNIDYIYGTKTMPSCVSTIAIYY